jgi:low affinity Fe/Cu permease
MSKLNDQFLAMADWVSEYMGHPSNIMFWAVAIIVWTLLFAFDKSLASGSFLPAWFTSQGYNFPLNLITTVAELFIGFLVAAATNRAQSALTNILVYIKSAIDKILAMDKKIEKMELQLVALIQENTTLTKEVEDRLQQRLSFINRPKEVPIATASQPVRR